MNFIGAWWIIYVASAGINFILALIVMRFSNSLIINKNDNAACHSNEEDESEKRNFKFHLKQFKKSGYEIISNPSFVFIVICTTSETLLIKGFSSYLTKFLEYQFRLPASTASK